MPPLVLKRSNIFNICIEVLSPEDTWKRLREKFAGYLAMGVPHIWAFDPDTRMAHRFDTDGLHVVKEAELTVPGTDILVNVAEVFSLLPKHGATGFRTHEFAANCWDG
jgi:Uma2 family endonuclease